MATARLASLLADDEAVELGDDLARGEGRSSSSDRAVSERHRESRPRSRGWCRRRCRRRSPAPCARSPRRPGRCRSERARPRPARSCRPSRCRSTPSSGSSTSPVPDSTRRRLAVGDDHHRLQPAQIAVGAPVLGQLDAGAHRAGRDTARAWLSSRSNRVKASAVAPAKPAITSPLPRRRTLRALRLDHGLAQADLAVAADRPPARPCGRSGWWCRASTGIGVLFAHRRCALGTVAPTGRRLCRHAGACAANRAEARRSGARRPGLLDRRAADSAS